MKLIFNELDITSQWLTAQLPIQIMYYAINCDVVTTVALSIVTALKERKQSEWETESIFEDRLFIAMYGFIIFKK